MVFRGLPMRYFLTAFVIFLGGSIASPVLAFSFSCADWNNKDDHIKADFWREATRSSISDCVQDMGFVMGFSATDRDDEGSTPVHWAARFSENPEVIAALLTAGADVNAANKRGSTPLHEAAGFNPNPDITMSLLAAGADGAIQNSDGKTPFDEAQKNESLIETDAYMALSRARTE
jgi:hypothetical protein